MERQLIVPWFTEGALAYIEKIDYKDMQIFEYGTGNSTLWFAQRCKYIITVDNDPEWKNGIGELAQGLTNIEFHVKQLIKCADCEYVQAINKDDKKYDMIIIDGRNRVLCAFEAVKHIKSGTIIIFDNSNRDEYKEGLELLNEKSASVMSWDDPHGKPWRTSIFVIK